MANWTDQYIEGKFRTEADPKDGFPIRECRDPRECRLLEFWFHRASGQTHLGNPHVGKHNFRDN